MVLVVSSVDESTGVNFSFLQLQFVILWSRLSTEGLCFLILHLLLPHMKVINLKNVMFFFSFTFYSIYVVTIKTKNFKAPKFCYFFIIIFPRTINVYSVDFKLLWFLIISLAYLFPSKGSVFNFSSVLRLNLVK